MAFQAGAIVSQLTLDRSKFSASIKTVRKQTKSLGGWVKKNSGQFKAMGLAATAAGAAVLLVFKKMVKQYIEVGDMVHKMALRTGFAAETLSELAYAADISGADLTMLEKGVKKMSKTIVDASYGLETYLRVFRSLGLDINDLLKMAPEEQFLKIGAAIAEMESDTLRTAAAVDVFGRSGTMLLPLFKEGAEGIEKLRKEAHTLGIIFDTEAAAKAAKLKDAQTALKGSVQGLSIAILNDLIPVLTDVTKEFTAWFVDSRQDATTWAQGLLSFFKVIAQGIQGMMLAFHEFKTMVFEGGELITRVMRIQLELWMKTIGLLAKFSPAGSNLRKIYASLGQTLLDLQIIGEGYNEEQEKQIDTMTDIITGFEKFFAVLDNVAKGLKKVKKGTEDTGKAITESLGPFTSWATGIGIIFQSVLDNISKTGRGMSDILGQAVTEMKSDIFEYKTTWQDTMREMLAGIGGAVGAMDSIFSQLHANEAQRIADQEKRQTDALESWFELERVKIERTITNEEEKVAALEALDEEKARKENELQHKMDKERRKLERKKAKAQKMSGLFAAGINVAEAITKALTAGPLIGQIFAGIVAALGAVQMAAIAAAPLPSLKEGGVIEKEGIYHLHAGEEVRPAPIVEGQMRGRATIYATVNIYPRRLDDRTINEAGEKILRVVKRQIGRY